MKRWLIAALFSSSLVILAESVSYKNFTTPPAPGAPRVVTPDKTVSYGGFQIQPMPGMKWGIAPGKGQRENMAFWAIVDAKNILHTTIAMVALSPQLPEQRLKKISLEILKEHMTKRLLSDRSGRFKNIKVSSQITTINGVKFAKVVGSAQDTGSRHAAKPLRLYAETLSGITSDGRIFTISISERNPEQNSKPDHAAINQFIHAVRLTTPQK